MAGSKILFIVGAGASTDANLPTGKQLRKTIASKLSFEVEDFGGLKHSPGDSEIIQAILQHVKKPDGESGDLMPYLRAGWRIRDAMPQASSIDDFIDDHRDDKEIALCGKLAIVRSILETERGGRLWFDHERPDDMPNFKVLEDTWYADLFTFLRERCRGKEIEKFFEDVSFITFNYDRCIEHFLIHAVRNYYGMPPDEAADLMRTLEIFHPYGMVGPLPWQSVRGSIPFGGDAHSDHLLALAGQIKTYSERIEDETELAEMRQLVHDAEVHVFLGFAFHSQNMELIKPAQPGRSKSIFATAHGTSENDGVVFKKRIKQLFDSVRLDRINLRKDLDCHGLFVEYGIVLSSI